MSNNKGLIQIYQGDTINIDVDGLDPSENYKMYFAVQNKRRRYAFPEIFVQTDHESALSLVVPSEYTDKLIVPLIRDYEDYYYGFKICLDDDESTLLVDSNIIGMKNILRVYPKKVEGYING